jgi:hypothetical protein
LLRSFLRAERLAFIEVFVPFFVSLLPQLIARYSNWRLFRISLQFVPVVAIAGFIAFFVIAEAGRSYEAKVAEGVDRSPLYYGAVRLGGYYGTSLNNGAYLLRHLPNSKFPYFTFDWLWRFPGVKAVFNPKSITGVDQQMVFNLLSTDMNIEFNNTSGIYCYQHDFGRIGFLIVTFVLGVFSAWQFFLFQEGTTSGRLLYPMLIMGFLEISRIPYLSGGRSFPSLALLAFLCLISLLVRAVKRTEF